MAHKSECGKGHIYDADIYASCPYCNGHQVTIDFSDKPATIGKTAPVSSMGIQPVAGQYSDVPGSTISPVTPAAQPAGIKPTAPVLGEPVAPEVIGPTNVIAPTKGIKDPVAGWLVCVEGYYQGKDFRLYARNNTVGRSPENDVCLSKDETVSARSQLNIAYDHKSNGFVMWSGIGIKNHNYLNGKAVFSEAPLSPYDVLEIGEMKFVFVPFCCEHFKWESVKK